MAINHTNRLTCIIFLSLALFMRATHATNESDVPTVANQAKPAEAGETGSWRPTTKRDDGGTVALEQTTADEPAPLKAVPTESEDAISEDEGTSDEGCKTASYATPADPQQDDVEVTPSEPDWITDRFFQPIETSWSWIIGGDNRIGFLSLEAEPSMVLDFNAEDRFELSFLYGIHFLHGPTQTDLPPHVFDLAVNLQIQQEIEPWMGVEANFSFGLHSDFKDSVREGLRFPGRALMYWDQSSDARWFAGVEYLDRDNIKILPAGGLLLRPDEKIRLDLYFPRPKARIRIERTDTKEKWFYVEGEYQGNSWAIERATGEGDVVTYSDYRLSLGIETVPRDEDESISFFEFSFLFDRELEYRSHLGDYNPGETVMFRAGHRH
jgi:hypothetical protein